jgi:hypothetical protein
MFPLGSTVVTATATDGHGGQAECSFQVTVKDTTPPVITCPPNLVIATSNPNGTAVTLPAATASDLVDPNPTVEYDAPSVFPLGDTIVTATAKDASGNVSNCSFKVTVKRTVTIDIKPGSYPNSINLGSNGTVPVAVLSTPAFDATLLNPASLKLAGAYVALKKNGTLHTSQEDVNGDGLKDLVLHFLTSQLSLTTADTEATLEGPFGTALVEGKDSVRIVK